MDHVSTGTEADSALLTNKEFDLLILDLGLPKCTDWSAAAVAAARLHDPGADPDRGRWRGRARAVWTSAPTTTWPSPSASRNSRPVCAPWCAGGWGAQATPSATARWSTTRPARRDAGRQDAGTVGPELGLLEVLLQRAGRMVSKDQLVERLCEWGDG